MLLEDEGTERTTHGEGGRMGGADRKRERIVNEIDLVLYEWLGKRGISLTLDDRFTLAKDLTDAVEFASSQKAA